MIKAIFWDNDGMLVNTEPLYFNAKKTGITCSVIPDKFSIVTDFLKADKILNKL